MFCISNFVSLEEKKELCKVCQTLLLAASATLRLSLMLQEVVQVGPSPYLSTY